MSISDDKVTALTFQHKLMPDRPNTLFSSAQLKAAFDSQAEQLQAGLNGLIDDLLSALDGDSGADNIGSATILGVSGNTVRAQLIDLKAQIQAIIGNSVPAGSITTAMIQNGAITSDKLSPEVVDSLQHNPQVIALERVQAQLVAIAEINGLSIGQSGYGYDLFLGPAENTFSAATMDLTRANVTLPLAFGASTLSISNISGGAFAIGQEITIQDVVSDTTRERKIISGIAGGGTILSISTPTTFAYAANANVYRSLATIDATNKKLDFGPALYNGSNITAAGTTTLNGTATTGLSQSPSARRFVRTARGWLVHVLSSATNAHSLLISKDGGLTWSQLCSNTFDSPNSGELGVVGDTVYWAMGGALQGLALYRVDTVAQTNVDIKLTNISVSGHRSMSPAMAIDSKGFLHIVTGVSGLGENLWFYYVSKDGGNTFVEKAIPMNSGYGGYTTIVIDKNDNAIVINYDSSSPFSVQRAVKIGEAYTVGFIPYPASGAGLTAIVKRSGSNIGRVIMVTSSSSGAYSDDNGVTWTAANPSFGLSGQTCILTENSNGDVYCLFHSTATTLNMTSMLNGTNVWTSPVTYDGTNISSSSLISCLEYATFTVPIATYAKSSTPVGTVVRGTYTPTLSKDVTQVDVRYNIVPPMGTMDELRSWIQYDDFTGFTVISAFSNVASGANEQFITMTADNTDFGSFIETYFEGATALPNSKSTQRITMNRAATTNNVGLTKYLAAIISD
jgi:hypothetical protein